MEAAESTQEGEGLIWISRSSLIRLKDEGCRLPLKTVRVRSRHSGTHLSRFRGRGMEFDEARPYQPGDEIRNLDWRVTARTGRPHTKLFREERERAVILWVDYRTPMFFATRGRFKSVIASQAAALIAWSARHHGDRLGGLIFSENGHREIRPRNGDRAVLGLIGLLSESSRSAPDPGTAAQRREAAGQALSRIRRVTRPGSMLFLISDFRDLGESAESHLAALARHNELLCLQIQDGFETELPAGGRFPVSDGRTFVSLDGNNLKLRQTYRQRHLARQNELGKLCQRHRVHLLSCATEGDLLETLKLGLGRQTG